jgi:transcriptional regulator with XRE-family HTH domain
MAASLNEHVAAEIRAELGRQNRSQASFAVALGWGRGYFYRRMASEIAFTVDELDKIAGELGVPLADLMSVSAA